MNLNKKTLARIASVQAIYQFAISEYKISVEELESNMVAHYKDRDALIEMGFEDGKAMNLHSLFRLLVGYVVDNKASIDEMISNFLLEEWNIKKMDMIVLSILRVAVCELLYNPATPSKVVINEFTNIASDLAKDSDIGFVNSTLDSVAQYLEQKRKVDSGE